MKESVKFTLTEYLYLDNLLTEEYLKIEKYGNFVMADVVKKLRFKLLGKEEIWTIELKGAEMQDYSENAMKINIEGALVNKFFLDKMTDLFNENSVNQVETVLLLRGQVGIIAEELGETMLETPMAKLKYIETLIDGLLSIRQKYEKELENFSIPNYTKQ